MRDIRLVFQSSCACQTLSPRPIRPALLASLGCQHRAIRLIGHGNTDEIFQKEKNIGLGNWINIINHGQEAAINCVCFLLGADHRCSPCCRDENGDYLAGAVNSVVLSMIRHKSSESSVQPSSVVNHRHSTHPLLHLSGLHSVHNTCLQVQQQNWVN